MLQNIKEFYGQKLGAIDGEIGHVKDFYFDDKSWAVRYLVVDTGTWLSGRLVLLTTHAFAANAFGTFDPASGALKVNLTRQQIENSPSIETHRPVSRQDEIDYYSYYGWPSYWHDYGIGALAGIPPVKIPSPPERHAHHGHNQRDDVHLRSVKDVTGYSVHATDGAIGTVSSFMVHGTDWAVREMVIETGHWYAGKPVLVSTKHVTLISHDESTVSLNLSKHDILGTQREGVEETAATNK